MGVAFKIEKINDLNTLKVVQYNKDTFFVEHLHENFSITENLFMGEYKKVLCVQNLFKI